MRTKRSAAVVIRSGDVGAGWLLVRRPEDDPELPGVWGLPAGTRRAGESWAALIARIGRDKLGVELEPGRRVAEGSADREGYRLAMRLYEAAIVSGTPETGRGPADVTQYAAWGWRDPTELRPGARRGSLCCRLGCELARAERR